MVRWVSHPQPSLSSLRLSHPRHDGSQVMEMDGLSVAAGGVYALACSATPIPTTGTSLSTALVPGAGANGTSARLAVAHGTAGYPFHLSMRPADFYGNAANGSTVDLMAVVRGPRPRPLLERWSIATSRQRPKAPAKLVLEVSAAFPFDACVGWRRSALLLIRNPSPSPCGMTGAAGRIGANRVSRHTQTR